MQTANTMHWQKLLCHVHVTYIFYIIYLFIPHYHSHRPSLDILTFGLHDFLVFQIPNLVSVWSV